MADGGSLTVLKSWVQAVSQGQPVGRCSVIWRPQVATLAGTLMSLRRMVAVVALARSRSRAGQGACAWGQVERHHCEHQPGGVRGELS